MFVFVDLSLKTDSTYYKTKEIKYGIHGENRFGVVNTTCSFLCVRMWLTP